MSPKGSLQRPKKVSTFPLFSFSSSRQGLSSFYGFILSERVRELSPFPAICNSNILFFSLQTRLPLLPQAATEENQKEEKGDADPLHLSVIRVFLGFQLGFHRSHRRLVKRVSFHCLVIQVSCRETPFLHTVSLSENDKVNESKVSHCWMAFKEMK